MIPSLVELARKHGARPRVHGNGFLQLDLVPSGNTRLHIWHPELPKQDVKTTVHDHVFDMDSTVKKGRLLQVVKHYALEHEGTPTDEVWMVNTRMGDDTVLGPTGVLVRHSLEETYLIEAGEGYSQRAFTFHDSIPQTDIVVTVMTKEWVHPGEPRIMVPVGLKPDNSFRRNDHDEEFLWKIIEESV